MVTKLSRSRLPKVHPSDITKTEWILSKTTTSCNGLIAEYRFATPDSLKAPPMSHHVIASLFTNGAYHRTQFERDTYEGRHQMGDTWLLPEGYTGSFQWHDPGEGVLFMLDPKLLQRIAIESNCINPDRIELRPVLYEADLKLIDLSRSFYAEMQMSQIGNTLAIDSLSNLFVIHLLRQHGAFQAKVNHYTDGLSPRKLRIAIDYISTHLDRDLRLDEIAVQIGISSYYFCKLFKQSTGSTPHQYVRQQRIHKAKELLVSSDISLVEIASHCGFADQSHFTKVFRQATGITPKQYRQKF